MVVVWSLYSAGILLPNFRCSTHTKSLGSTLLIETGTRVSVRNVALVSDTVPVFPACTYQH